MHFTDEIRRIVNRLPSVLRNMTLSLSQINLVQAPDNDSMPLNNHLLSYNDLVTIQSPFTNRTNLALGISVLALPCLLISGVSAVVSFMSMTESSPTRSMVSLNGMLSLSTAVFGMSLMALVAASTLLYSSHRLRPAEEVHHGSGLGWTPAISDLVHYGLEFWRWATQCHQTTANQTEQPIFEDDASPSP